MKRARIRGRNNFRKLQSELNKVIRGGGVSVVIRCVHIGQPIEDDRFEDGVWQFLALAGAHAVGADETSRTSECFVCQGEWSWTRVVRGFVLIEFIDKNGTGVMGTVAGLCPDCWGDTKRLYTALERDFGLKPDGMRHIHEGGSA
jgi:hypothetical protein